MHDLALKIALIGAAGIAAQWVAWRINLPAIALLLITGFVMGPLTGFVNPIEDLGNAYKPAIGLAVALILFEGGLTLNFKEIRETSTAVRRIIMFGGPMVLVLGTLAGVYAGGLSWQTAVILGSILVVTGPTVIMPLLRQARLKLRPASLLRWEAIVNDPIGALCAVVAFELVMISTTAQGLGHLIQNGIIALVIAVPGGYLIARAIAWAYVRGHVPEYLKAPVLVVTALFTYAVSNTILEEAGLLTVTVLGITLANTRIASLAEMRRFKETITIILVSGVFILLTASLKMETILGLGWEAAAFVFAVLFLVRPIAIGIATWGSGLSWQERVLVSWIAPRGIVAVAVAGLFGSSLVAAGIEDGEKMLAYTFAVVAATILLHGFSLPVLARVLSLRSAARPGILIVGGSPWSSKLARQLKDLEIPVLIADANWNRLRDARSENIDTFFGDVLTEDAHHHLELNGYGHLIATTDNDSYNALICTDFAPEIGRSHVFQLGDRRVEKANQHLHFTIGGRPLFNSGLTYWDLQEKLGIGWGFSTTDITETFDLDRFVEERPQAEPLLWVDKSGEIVFYRNSADRKPGAGSRLVSFGPKKSNGKNAKKDDTKQPDSPARESDAIKVGTVGDDDDGADMALDAAAQVHPMDRPED